MPICAKQYMMKIVFMFALFVIFTISYTRRWLGRVRSPPSGRACFGSSLETRTRAGVLQVRCVMGIKACAFNEPSLPVSLVFHAPLLFK